MKVLDVSAQAGLTAFESPAINYTEMDLSLDELLIENIKATYLTRVQGDSMVGFGIHSGDILVCDRSLDAKTGDIIIVNYDGNFLVKLYDKENHRLLSGSDTFKPIELNECLDVKLEGVVTRVVKILRPFSGF